MSDAHSILSELLAGVPASSILEEREPLASYSELLRVATHFERRRFFESVAERRAEWHLANLRQLRKMRGPRPIAEVRDVLDPQRFFEEFYFRNEPLVIRSVRTSWWPFESFTLSSITEKFGDQVVRVMTGRSRYREADADPEANSAEMRLSDYIRYVREAVGDDQYLIGLNRALEGGLLPLVENLAPLVGVLEDSFRPDAGLPTVWIGPKGTISNLHFDTSNVFNVQVEGSKRFVLIPSDNTCYLYNSRGIFSEVDVLNPDPVLHPLYARAERYEVELNSGDAIFIPVGWWHFVEALAPSVSVAFNRFVVNNTFAMPSYLLGQMAGK